MEKTRYLIVGGGSTADAACRGILALDPDPDAVLVVAGEEHPPYARPSLSKTLWKGDAEETVFKLTGDLGVRERLGRRIVELDLEARTATDDRAERYTYEKVLLATGGRPRRLPFGDDRVIYFRTLTDYRRLRRLADADARIVVVGGGFIGSEIAAALALSGCRVTMVFRARGICERVLPPALAHGLVEYYRECGVEVLDGAAPAALDSGRVVLADSRSIAADAVVAGIGIEPNAELAAAAGLPVDDGIVVDTLGRAGGRADAFAAGDVARFPDPVLGGKPRRVEHVKHAEKHGHQVGANMAGAGEPYDELPLFYSDLFDLGYEAVGELDSRLTIESEVGDVHAEGAIYYLDAERRPRGVLLWNRYGCGDGARELIVGGEPLPAAGGRRYER